jgi:hypothetical protein
VCRSILALQENEVIFSGCVPGGTYYRDFTLQNLSDIPLHFSMNLSTATAEAVNSKVLEFSFFDMEGEGQANETGTNPPPHNTPHLMHYSTQCILYPVLQSCTPGHG